MDLYPLYLLSRLAITPASGRYGDRPNRGVSRAKIGRCTSKAGTKRTSHRCFQKFTGPWAHTGNMKGYHRALRKKICFITPIPPGIVRCVFGMGEVTARKLFIYGVHMYSLQGRMAVRCIKWPRYLLCQSSYGQLCSKLLHTSTECQICLRLS
jgi:hypothetical protein